MSLLGCMKCLWKNISRGWGKFSSHTGFEVGDGSRSVSAMICGVEIWLLRTHFQIYLTLCV
jgi:hypothetical protein